VKPLYSAVLNQGFLFVLKLKALTLCRDLPRATLSIVGREPRPVWA